jgi:hypothetical protein
MPALAGRTLLGGCEHALILEVHCLRVRPLVVLHSHETPCRWGRG